MNVKENKKVKITRNILKTCLVELLKEKNIDKISVTELCSAANVNRGTFYKHYDDVEGLLESVEKDTLQRITEFINQVSGKSNIEIFTMAFEAIKENQLEYNVLLVDKGNLGVTKKVGMLLKEKLLTNWKVSFPKFSDFQLNEMFVFVCSGLLGLIKVWVEGGFVEAPDVMGKVANSFVTPFHFAL